MDGNQRKIGILVSYAGQMVYIISGFIYTPIMLRLLGQSEYGLYQLVNSVVSYLSILSLGFGSSYMRFYSREKSNGDDNEIAKLNGMFMIIFLVIALICILCGIVMIGNIRGIFGTGLSDSEYYIARILMVLMIVNLALSFPNSMFNCIITSQEKFIFQKTLALLQNLLNPFLTLPLLIMGHGSIVMVAVTTLLTLGVLIINIYYCFKKIHVEFRFKGLKFSLLKEMWIFTFFIFLNQIIDQINLNVDKFLLGRLAGTTSVAIYGVGAQINTLYMQFSASVSNVFVPKVNKIVAEEDDNKKLTLIFTKVGRIQFIILMLILSGFFFFGKAFIRFWAGDGYGTSYYVAFILMLPITVPLIQNIGIEIQRAKNKHQTRSIVYFFIAIANVGISIPLIKIFGPIGATTGTALSLFVGNILFMNWYYHNYIGIDIWFFWKNIINFAPGMIVPFVFGIISNIFISFSNIYILGMCIVLYTGLYCISMYLFSMNMEEKEVILAPIRKIRHLIE